MSCRIIITGATSGLGKALTEILIKNTSHLIIAVGRNSKKIDELRRLSTDRHRCKIVQCDFQDREAIINASTTIQKHCTHKHPTHIVHCAGIVEIGNLNNLTAASVQRALQVNLLAPLELTKKILPVIKHGRILFISTGLTKFSLPDMGAYSISKSAFEALCRQLNVEVDPAVAISAIVYPGIFDSPMQKHLREAANFTSAETFKRFLSENQLQSTHTVAQFILNVLLHSSSEDFKTKEWDFNNQEHHKILL